MPRHPAPQADQLTRWVLCVNTTNAEAIAGQVVCEERDCRDPPSIGSAIHVFGDEREITNVEHVIGVQSARFAFRAVLGAYRISTCVLTTC